jgi:hypothetical protein
MAQIRVQYFGTNVGPIYLSDTGKRLALGGGQEGGYGQGQDQYIMWGETVIFQATGEVLMSEAYGILKYFSAAPASGAWINGAPLVLTSGSYTSANEVPGRDYTGDTGIFTDDYLSKLANTRYSTGAAGATGYFYGNQDYPGVTGASS